MFESVVVQVSSGRFQLIKRRWLSEVQNYIDKEYSRLNFVKNKIRELMVTSKNKASPPKNTINQSLYAKLFNDG